MFEQAITFVNEYRYGMDKCIKEKNKWEVSSTIMVNESATKNIVYYQKQDIYQKKFSRKDSLNYLIILLNFCIINLTIL